MRFLWKIGIFTLKSHVRHFRISPQKTVMNFDHFWFFHVGRKSPVTKYKCSGGGKNPLLRTPPGFCFYFCEFLLKIHETNFFVNLITFLIHRIKNKIISTQRKNFKQFLSLNLLQFLKILSNFEIFEHPLSTYLP